jgi:hypothetical protein
MEKEEIKLNEYQNGVYTDILKNLASPTQNDVKEKVMMMMNYFKTDEVLHYVKEACKVVSEDIKLKITVTNDQEEYKDIFNILEDGTILTSLCRLIPSEKDKELNTSMLIKGRIINSLLPLQEMKLDNPTFIKYKTLVFLKMNTINKTGQQVIREMEIIFYINYVNVNNDEKFVNSTKYLN